MHMDKHADLHMHTTASDGDLSPAALVALAAERQLTTIAITDHDTTDGIAEAQAAASSHGISVIPAIELSAESKEYGDVHMLGYFIDASNEGFQERLADFRENRYHRGRGIIRKLHKLGVPLEWEAVAEAADGAPITRPHIAKALVRGGYVKNLQQAFDQYLENGGPAYVDRVRMLPEEAVDLIHSAGGAAVVAHPGLVSRYQQVLSGLAEHGLDGVEAFHPKNSADVTQKVKELALERDLILTGGSDFHRPNDESGIISLGTTNPPADAVERLGAAAQSV